MTTRYYYAIAGEVSPEPVCLEDVPAAAEYVCTEGSEDWEPVRRGSGSPVVRFFKWFVATRARAKLTAQFALVLLCTGLGIWLVAQYAAATPPGPRSAQVQQTLDARVSLDGMFLRVDLADDHAGRPVVLHLNGTPGMRGTYRNDVTWPHGSDAALIPLVDFSRQSDGAFFNPLTHRPTEVWVGGGGYSHQRYSF